MNFYAIILSMSHLGVNIYHYRRLASLANLNGVTPEEVLETILEKYFTDRDHSIEQANHNQHAVIENPLPHFTLVNRAQRKSA